MRRARRQGFTLIELLLAAAMLGTVLAALGMYFVRTTDLDRRTQAQADVQDKVRTGAQLLTQDLQTLGSSRYVKDNQVILLSVWADCSVSPKCLDGANGTTSQSDGVSGSTGPSGSPSETTGASDSLSGRYITSLLPENEACRNFAYRVNSGKLERSETSCSITAPNYVELLDGVLGFDIVYFCSDNSQVTAPSCPPVVMGGKSIPRFVRSAQFSLIARSNQVVKGAGGQAFTLPSGGSLTCPQDRVCFAMTQDVLMPNLKDR